MGEYAELLAETKLKQILQPACDELGLDEKGAGDMARALILSTTEPEGTTVNIRKGTVTMTFNLLPDAPSDPPPTEPEPATS